jgi:hypothetical protein
VQAVVEDMLDRPSSGLFKPRVRNHGLDRWRIAEVAG